MTFYIFYVFQRYIISPYDALGGLYDVLYILCIFSPYDDLGGLYDVLYIIMYFRGTISLRTTTWEVYTTYNIFYVFQRCNISPYDALGGLYDVLYILCISEVHYLSVRRLGRFIRRMIYFLCFRSISTLQTTVWRVYTTASFDVYTTVSWILCISGVHRLYMRRLSKFIQRFNGFYVF